MRADDPRHGTHAGYKKHRADDEAACESCLRANTRYHKRLVYDLTHGRRRMRPTTGAVRRIHALQRLGWSLRTISREGGWGGQQETLRYVVKPSTQLVTPAVDDMIRAVYDKLSMRVPPAASGSTRARKYAERKGWPPPLAWDNIDDPDEQARGVCATPRHRKPYREVAGHVVTCPRCGVRRQVNESRERELCRDCKSVEKVA